MTAVNLNRAVRGPVTAVPVVAGKGVRLVADTVNNRFVVEADETVLWEGKCNTESSVTLSESYKNFEKIRICGYHASGAGMLTEAYTADIMATNNKEITLQSWTGWDNSASYKFAMSVPCNFTSDTVLATKTGRFVGYWDNQWQARIVNDIMLTRVIGINRISST